MTSDRDYTILLSNDVGLMVLVVRSSRLQVQKLLKCLLVPFLFAFLVLFCHLALYLFAPFILLLSSHNSKREAALWYGGWVQRHRLKRHNIFKKSLVAPEHKFDLVVFNPDV